MYREKDLTECLFGLVGFRQNNNPEYPKLAASLLLSSSGQYVQDQHPLLCIENIDQSLKNYDHYNFDLYNIGTTYPKGVRVRFTDNLVYESIDDGNVGNDPTASGSLFWVLFDLFSQKLDALMRAAIGKVVAEVFIQKKIEGSTKSLIENIQIFEGSGPIIDKEIKLGRFVGFALKLNRQRDLAMIIRRIGTQFSAPNPDFKLYVYHSSSSEPVAVLPLALAKQNAFEWTKLIVSGSEFILRDLDDNHDSGGTFYIGYYEDDLQGQAINRQYNFASVPTCGSCNNDLYLYNQWSQFFEIAPFKVLASDLVGKLPGDVGGPVLWDENVNQYEYSKNYGLNLDMSVKCDVTDFLCREGLIMADAIMKQIVVDILNLIAYSTRNNVITKEVQTLAMYELNNKPEYTPGAVKKLERAIAALSFDLSGLNDSCLPCSNSKGPTWGSVG